MAKARIENPVTVVTMAELSDSMLIMWPLESASANAAPTTPRVSRTTAMIWPQEYLLALKMYPTMMDATGPPDRTMMCNGTEILYAKAQLFRRLIVTKYAVYISHERIGIARGFKNNDRGPADIERKFGDVKSAVRMNCTNVIKGPIYYALTRGRD